MDPQTEREILDAHIARLNAGLSGPAAYPPMTPRQRQALEPLLQLAEMLYKVLVPVEPSPAFVRHLGRELAEAAAWEQLPLLQRYRRAIVLSVATAGPAFSVLGLVLLYLLRQRRAARHAAPSLAVADTP